MVEGGPSFHVAHTRVEGTGETLARYLASEDNPEEYRVRRMAFTNKAGMLDSEFDEANTGTTVSGSSLVQEVRRGMLLAFNDQNRGAVDGYMQVEAEINVMVTEITEEVAAHPGFSEVIVRNEKVLEVLETAGQTVYSRPAPQVPPTTS
jgi:hypothetical protein